jgi:hypothetical protein
MKTSAKSERNVKFTVCLISITIDSVLTGLQMNAYSRLTDQALNAKCNVLFPTTNKIFKTVQQTHCQRTVAPILFTHSSRDRIHDISYRKGYPGPNKTKTNSVAFSPQANYTD